MLKIVALTFMLIDHIGLVLVPIDQSFYWRAIGRIAFPLFAYSLAKGYKHTKNYKRYVLRVAIFAVVSQPAFAYLLYSINPAAPNMLNVGFTLLIGLLCLKLMDYLKAKPFLRFFCVLVLVVLAELIQTDYGALGVTTILVFYHFVVAQQNLPKAYGYLCFIYYMFFALTNLLSGYFRLTPKQTTFFHVTSSVVLVLLVLLIIRYVKDKQIPKTKYLFYIFYPLHMLLLVWLKNYWI